jgi:hypothetical protein
VWTGSKQDTTEVAHYPPGRGHFGLHHRSHFQSLVDYIHHVIQTMQTLVHQLPTPLRPRYSRQSLNGVLNTGPSIMPTPPVATRKRKRAHQYTVSYSEVQEVDSDGKLREVIVIEDTPPPATISPATTYNNGYSASYQPPIYSAPIRTRARAAAEAQALSASTSSAAIVTKKRKKDHRDEHRIVATRKKALQPSSTLHTAKSWASGSVAATDDVCLLRLLAILSLNCPCRLQEAPSRAMIKKDTTSLSQTM